MKTPKWKKNMYKSIDSRKSHQDEVSALELASAVLMEPFGTRQEKRSVLVKFTLNKTF